MRSFDPRKVGSLECRAWETYYRRKWAAFLVASVARAGRVRDDWPRTLVGRGWSAANQKWAPCRTTTPTRRALMASFYRLVKASEGLAMTPRRASWRSSGGGRIARTSTPQLRERRGADRALADLDAYTYGVEQSEVRRAAELRAEAMDVSDRWVAAGCDPEDPLLAEERALLVRSFAALLAAVHRPARREAPRAPAP